MTTEYLLAFNIALLAAVASPGPALLVALRTTLGAGRRAGIAIGCGLATVAALWTLMALVGLDAVFDAFPWAYVAVKTVGALYLIYIAWTMWRGATQPIAAAGKPAPHAFRQGVLINLLNPKSVLFAGAVLVVIFPPGMSWAENALVMANHLIVEVLFYTALAVCLSTKSVSERYLRAKRYIDRIAALILGALGIRILTA